MRYPNPGCPSDGSSNEGQSGSILIWALLFTIVCAGMIISHTTYMAANRSEMDVRFQHTTLAEQFARSGLTDALSWYRKQPSQPVTGFNPQLDPNGDPPLLETIDPAIGLVREFEVRGNLWARYEIRTSEVQDISSERGMVQAGTVWDLGARGFLFVRNDPTQPFGAKQNRVIASTYLRNEIQGIPINLPAEAAISMIDPTQLTVLPGASIDGGARPGLVVPTAVLPLAPTLIASLVGTPATAGIPGLSLDSEDVFSMQSDRLGSLSDHVREEGTEIAVVPGFGGDGGSGLVRPVRVPLVGNWSWSSDDDGSSIRLSQEEESWSGSTESGSSFLEGLAFWQEQFRANIATTNVVGSTTQSWLEGTNKYAAGRGKLTTAVRQSLSKEPKSVMLKGDHTFDDRRSLNGTMLVVVDGDCTIAANNISRMRGLLYVTGDCQILGDFRLDGSLIVKGKLDLGDGVNTVQIRWDAQAIADLKRSLERYRFSRTIRPGWN